METIHGRLERGEYKTGWEVSDGMDHVGGGEGGRGDCMYSRPSVIRIPFIRTLANPNTIFWEL